MDEIGTSVLKLSGSVFPEGHFRSRHGNPGSIKWSRYVSSAGSGSLFYLFFFSTVTKPFSRIVPYALIDGDLSSEESRMKRRHNE